MGATQNDQSSINLALYKRLGFYQLFDPSSPKIFNINVYRLVNVVFIIIVQILNAFSVTGFFAGLIDQHSDIDLLLIIMFYYNSVLSLLKIIIILYKADQMWELIDITRLDFLTSVPCSKYIDILYEYRDRLIKITGILNGFAIFTFCIWVMLSAVINIFAINNDPDLRINSIVKLPYPVTTNFYNEFYWLFYSMEVTLGIFNVYYTLLIDTFIMSLCWTIMGQYDMVSEAFTNIDNEDDKHENGKYHTSTVLCEDLKSIIVDHANVIKKLNLFYSMLWLLVLLHVLLNSCSLITLMYSFIVLMRVCFNIVNVMLKMRNKKKYL